MSDKDRLELEIRARNIIEAMMETGEYTSGAEAAETLAEIVEQTGEEYDADNS